MIPTANIHNTVFLTVVAFENHEGKIQTFRQSVQKHHIPVVYCDKGDVWQGFYYHKIEKMISRLEQMQLLGYDYAFILDSRDVVFIDDIELVFEKFNKINRGKVIFNHDTPGKIWPSHDDSLRREMEKAMRSKHARLNAGMIAGEIGTILKIQNNIIQFRKMLLDGRPHDGILRKIYQERGLAHINDDQHLYQIEMVYHSEWFQIDYDKELFAVLKTYPNNIHDFSNDPGRHDVINNAAIIHSPWLSRKQEWHERLIQNTWNRKRHNG